MTLSLDERREWWLPDVAAYFGITVRHLRRMLDVKPAWFPPHFRRRGRHPRTHRFLYHDEVLLLALMRDGKLPGWPSVKRKKRVILRKDAK